MEELGIEELQSVAVQAARAGAKRAMASFRGDHTVEQKATKTDVVTDADRGAQRAILDKVRDNAAPDTVIAEEQATEPAVPETGQAWIIDPIDGTHNYTRGSRLWTTSLAVLEDKTPRVAVSIAPALGDEYLGVNPPDTPAQTYRNEDRVAVSDISDPRQAAVGPLIWWPFDRREEYTALTEGMLRRFADLRRLGSAQLTLARVAAGDLGGAITNITAAPWDTVAGVALVRWAGGRATDIHGDPWQPTSDGVVVSNGLLHDELLSVGEAVRAPAGPSLED